jgi:dTDP-L-rhamnose 4-epimerase
MQRNILITGGAGFIGARLVAALLKTDPESNIWILDNLHPQVHGKNAKNPCFSGSVKFVRGDVADKSVMQALLKSAQPELIYHLAAETGTGQSYEEVSRYCEVNVTGTANLIEAVRSESSAVTKKIVLAASRAVYGEGGYRDSDGRVYVGLPRQSKEMSCGDFSVHLPIGAKFPAQAIPSNATLPVAPASVYASSKLMQEYLLKQTGEGSPWKVTILRFQNVYGPGQSLRNPYTGVLSIFCSQLLEGKKLAIYEDGLTARDFIYVDDVVDALVKAGQNDLPHGATLDIGTGESVSILDVARLLMQSLSIQDDQFTITGQFRVGDIRHACADISEAQKLMGWEPHISIEDGLSLLANWARIEFQLNKAL